MPIHTYHSRRERTEIVMAADADSAVARIAHRKLAALHALSADRAVEAAVWRARGESPIAQPTVL